MTSHHNRPHSIILPPEIYHQSPSPSDSLPLSPSDPLPPPPQLLIYNIDTRNDKCQGYDQRTHEECKNN